MFPNPYTVMNPKSSHSTFHPPPPDDAESAAGAHLSSGSDQLFPETRLTTASGSRWYDDSNASRGGAGRKTPQQVRDASIRYGTAVEEETADTVTKLVSVLAATCFPFPYGLYHGIEGDWDMVTFTYIFQFITLKPMDREGIRPGLTVWSLLIALVALLLYLVIGKAPVFLVFSIYYFMNLGALMIFWVKNVCGCRGDRRRFYETI